MKINYTVDANGFHIQGVDQTNPVIYDNDFVKDVPEPFYLWLKANRKEVNLVANISSHNGHPGAQPHEKQPALFNAFNELYNAFKAMGGQNVPAPILGSTKNLTNGQTSWENSAGSDKIISEAKKASAAKPLVIFVGGQATTVANAYLKDKSIKDNIVVLHVDSIGKTNFNAIDGWAVNVLIDGGVALINWDGDANSWYDEAGSPQYRGSWNPPIKRMPGITFANINNGFHNMYKSNFAHMYDAYGSIGDGPVVFWFFNHSLWQNVIRKNKQNQTVTTEDYAFLLVSKNNWTQYGPQLSAYMNNPTNYIPVTTPLPNQPPSVAITSGNTFTPGPVNLTANASDDQQVTKVEFFIDGNKIGEDTQSPYVVSWQAIAGTYTITAKATDNHGAVTTSAPVTITVSDVVAPPIEPPIPVVGGVVSVKDFGARGDGATDDTKAFQDAINKVGYRGKLIIPLPSKFYKITNTLFVGPGPANQVFMDIESFGWGDGTNTIRYMGASNKPVFKIVGLKSALWTGLKVGIQDGLTGVQIFDIDTTPSSQSSSFNTFKTFYLNLGNGQDNIAIRTGNISGGGADISNYAFESIVVFGGGTLGQSGEAITIPGQYAFQNLGANTLSMVWRDGFVAACDRVYTNRSRDGLKRGNGSVMFYGLGGSQNNIDFEFAFEQSYIVSGGRWEGGNKFMRISDGGFANVVIQGLTIHDYKAPDGLIEAFVTASIKLDGVFATWTKFDSQGNPTKTYNHIVTLTANDAARPRAGSLRIDGGGFSATKPYSKSGSAEWGVKVSDVGKIRIQYAESLFADENVRIP